MMRHGFDSSQLGSQKGEGNLVSLPGETERVSPSNRQKRPWVWWVGTTTPRLGKPI